MHRTMPKTKLHGAHVTDAEPDYEGSVANDTFLFETADIREYQRVEVYNLTNSERFAAM